MFIGLDVHKATISAAVANGERGGEVRDWGKLPNRPDRVRKLAEQLAAKGQQLYFCYEAGPCGYGLYRQLVDLGHDCIVVAPSLIPVKSGDRVKTDRRDARMLAKLHRASELTAVWVPDVEHEAMRDLIRARATAVRIGIRDNEANIAQRIMQDFGQAVAQMAPGRDAPFVLEMRLSCPNFYPPDGTLRTVLHVQRWQTLRGQSVIPARHPILFSFFEARYLVAATLSDRPRLMTKMAKCHEWPVLAILPFEAAVLERCASTSVLREAYVRIVKG
ncbi:transposase [Roseinatronobacter monicus]|uniref:Transposase n=1 Tax=Roseinatronobacter monicus TaxID=393481 RepID=A0A543KBF0_9RHOB|nr:transposase [Roseinatronobacter monicus]